MTPIRSILVATDFSHVAGAAVARAARLAKLHGAKLTLLHVMPPLARVALAEFRPVGFDAETRLVADAQKRLGDAARAASAKGTVETQPELRMGDVLEELLKATETADLVVLGARGESTLKDALLGTTAERVLRKSRTPSLVVKSIRRSDYQVVIVPVDFSAHSAAALRAAQRIAPTAQVNVLHAFNAPFEGKLRIAGVSEEELNICRIEARKSAEAALMRFLEQQGDVDHEMFRIVEHGYPPKIVRDKEVALRADLVVIGKHGKSLVETLFLGGVTRHVLADTHCDVLMVPEPDASGT